MLKELSKISVYNVYKGLQFRNLKKKALQIIHQYLQTDGGKKLHIGAGGTYLDGWLNVDLEPLENRIAYMDAANDYPLPDSSMDFVYCEHLFEHLSFLQQMKMLNEVLRVLKPGGVFRVATPNLDAILETLKSRTEFSKEYIEWAVKTYVPQVLDQLGEGANDEVFVINNYFYNWGHQCIHNKRTLFLMLQKAGFLNITNEEIYKSQHSVFRDLDTHGNVIPRHFNEMETMIFEAEKTRQ
jgi:predicted SAM-dependent methyltransferase